MCRQIHDNSIHKNERKEEKKLLLLLQKEREREREREREKIPPGIWDFVGRL
jgi:hypothetical protein